MIVQKDWKNYLKVDPTDWLLEEDNPGVRVRALTGLCDLPRDDKQVRAARRVVKQTLNAARDLSWMELKGLAPICNLTALADMMRGWKVADAIIIFGSIDICMGEVDR